MNRGICLFASIALVSAQTTWKHVSTFEFDWDGRRDVRVALELPARWDYGGDFSRIRIRVPGQKPFSLSTQTGWERLEKQWRGGPSPYVLVRRVAENRTALFLIGYGYGSSTGTLDVIELNADGYPRVVLHVKELGLKEIRDLDGDGIAEIVGYPCLSELFGDGWQTYDPFPVYRLNRRRDSMQRGYCCCDETAEWRAASQLVMRRP